MGYYASGSCIDMIIAPRCNLRRDNLGHGNLGYNSGRDRGYNDIVRNNGVDRNVNRGNNIEQREARDCGERVCKAHVRFVHNIATPSTPTTPLPPGLPSNIFIDREIIVRGLIYRLHTGFIPVSDDRHTVRWDFPGTSTTLTLDFRPKEGRHYTVIAEGNFTNSPVLKIYETCLKCSSVYTKTSGCKKKQGKRVKECTSKISFINGAAGSPEVDVYLDEARLFADVAYTAMSDSRCIRAGTYPIRIVATGTGPLNGDDNEEANDHAFDNARVLVGPIALDFYENYVYTIILTGRPNDLGIIVLKDFCSNKKIVDCNIDSCCSARYPPDPSCKPLRGNCGRNGGCNKGGGRSGRCNKGCNKDCHNCECLDLVDDQCGNCAPGCKPITSRENFVNFINPCGFVDPYNRQF